MLSEKRKGPFCMVAASVCWSFGGVCIAFIPWGAMSIIGIRSLLAAIVFIIYKKSVKVELTKGNMLSALCLSATIILFVFANKLTTAAAAILLQFSAPIFIILIHLVFYKKKPRLSETVAVLITISGMLLFFADQLDGGALLGNLFAILSGLAFAGVFVCNKRKDAKPEQALFLGFLINAAAGLPFVFFQVTADFVAWIAVLFLGIVQVGFAYIFFSIGIKRTPALLACLITAMEPVLNPIWVVIATSFFMAEAEIPGFFSIIGGAVIVLTVVFYNIWLEKHPQKLDKQ
ncbi:MAG: DMT family transporter [Oscillospiraceae bacterium]|jgi:drug/metabolite transporter (DMT)-like permease|nr:DMT family transporter [Oscillospiraceae bacterium]